MFNIKSILNEVVGLYSLKATIQFINKYLLKNDKNGVPSFKEIIYKILLFVPKFISKYSQFDLHKFSKISISILFPKIR